MSGGGGYYPQASLVTGWNPSHVTLTSAGTWAPSAQPSALVDPSLNNTPLTFNTSRLEPYVREGGGSRDRSVESGGSIDMVLSDGANSPGPDGGGGRQGTRQSNGSRRRHQQPQQSQQQQQADHSVYSNNGWNPMNQEMMNAMINSGDPSMMQGYAAGSEWDASVAANYAQWMGCFDGEDYQQHYQQQQATEPMKLKFCDILPRKLGLPAPSTRERPEGCRTVFVGGVPEWVQEKVVADVFGWCGDIESIRLSKKNFCHIRFKGFDAIDRAVSISGAHVKVHSDLVPSQDEFEAQAVKEAPLLGPTKPPGEDEPGDSDDVICLEARVEKPSASAEEPKRTQTPKKLMEIRNPFRIHVDYAAARDDKYEWDCINRAMRREERHRQREVEAAVRPPSPVGPTQYTDVEAGTMAEKLKGDNGPHEFSSSCSTLLNWLERGEVNKRSANNFYTLLQSVHSYLRNLVKEKGNYDEEVVNTREMLRQKLNLIVCQFEQIVDVYTKAKAQKAWDHFTKAQRRNINDWKKLSEQLKAKNAAEVLKERVEDEMEMSDDEVKDAKDEDGSLPPPSKRFCKRDTPSEEVSNLKEENDQLRCQLHAYENENQLLKSENKSVKESSENERKMMQNIIKGLHDRLMESQAVVKKDKEKLTKLETPKNNESLMETIQLFLKISDQRKEKAKKTKGNEGEKQDKDKSEEKSEEKSSKDSTSKVSTKDSTSKDSTEDSASKDLAEDSSSKDLAEDSSSGQVDEEMQLLREKLTALMEKHLKDTEERTLEAAAPVSRSLSTTPESGAPKIDGKLAQIIGIVSCFLNVHPSGASMAYIWSYLKQMENTTLGLRCSDVESRVMEANPQIFRKSGFGVGASIEERWVFVGFEDNITS